MKELIEKLSRLKPEWATHTPQYANGFRHGIEMAAKEVKAALSQKQEAVGKIVANSSGQISMQDVDGDSFDMSCYIGATLYTAPPSTAQGVEPSAFVTKDCFPKIWLSGVFTCSISTDKTEIYSEPLYLSQPAAQDGMVMVDAGVLDLTRFLANTWDEIDDFVYANCENLSAYPVIQGTRNQANIRNIGAQDFNKDALKKGVEFMLKAASKGE